MPFDAIFDARQFQPNQGGGGHPVGNKFPFKITGTEVKDTKEKDGKYFMIEFTSPAGSIKNNYNLWNNSPQAQSIALGQLSALCHAVGIFNVDFKNDGAALRGGEGLMDIAFQKGQEPSAEKPAGGYVELKKVYDKAGNEPGKGPAPQAQAQPQQTGQQPVVQNGGFQANAAPAANPGAAWGGNAAPAANQPQQGGWQQGATAESPPWKQ